MEQRDLRVLLELLVQQEPQAQQVRLQVLQEQPDLQEHLVLQDLQVILELVVLEEEAMQRII
jgi:hypothetical protein